MVKNKKCLSCGTKFSYCPDCSRVDALKPSWASQFCSESCAILWKTLTKFGMSMLDKSEAQSIILGLDLKSIESYVPCVQRDYDKVMKSEKKPKRGKRIKIQPMDDAIDIPEEVVDTIVEELIEVKIEQSTDVVVIEEPVHEVVLKEDE